MKKYFLPMFLSLLLAPAAHADNKIGFVNIARIFSEAAPAVKATKKLEKEFSGREEELKKMGLQIRTLQGQIEKAGVTLPEADRKNKEREIVKLTTEFTRMQREFREDLNVRRNEELASIQEKARSIIQQIATTDKYDLIVQDAVYWNPKIDMTDRVLKALEK